MAKIKSNPYVYPYVPFKTLRKKAGNDFLVGKKSINFQKIKNVLNMLKRNKIITKGKSMEEKIFNIFLSKEVLFGPEKFIIQNKKYWMEKISFYTKQSKKIRFTLLGFPFKIPVPLKTNRIYPDMGEALILFQLNNIAENIKRVYSPGAEIVIFTEGGLGKFVGISKREADEYKKFLIKINKKLGFANNLRIKDLSDMEKEKHFPDIFSRNFSELKQKFESKDKEIIKKFRKASDSISKIINTRYVPETVLRDVYNHSLNDKNISLDAKKIRSMIYEKMPNIVLRYFAYLKTRDDLKYLEKTIPGALALSVSPKNKRLGIMPISKRCDKLPYHAVPIFIPQKKIFYLEYLTDMKYGNKKFTPVWLREDKEKKPFYYEYNS